MKKKRSFFWIFSGLLLAIGSATAQTDMPTEVEPAFLRKNFVPQLPRIANSEEHEEAKWLLYGTVPRLEKEEYDFLEKMALNARTSKAIFSTGNWHLTLFYKGVTSYGGKDPQGDRSIAMLSKWAKERPQSITAQVALAQGWVNYAWVASGNGETEPDWKLFRERIEQARMVLREAKNLPEKDPHWWSVAQEVGICQHWDEATFDGLYQEAIDFEPTYYPYYFNKATYFLERWHGKKGDPERFAVEAADAFGKLKGQAQGDALYARMFWNFDARHFSEVSFQDKTLMSIERIERGMQELARQYPDNVVVHGAWVQMYYLNQNPANKAKALQLLPKTRNIVDPWVWHNMDAYNSVVLWLHRS